MGSLVWKHDFFSFKLLYLCIINNSTLDIYSIGLKNHFDIILVVIHWTVSLPIGYEVDDVITWLTIGNFPPMLAQTRVTPIVRNTRKILPYHAVAQSARNRLVWFSLSLVKNSCCRFCVKLLHSKLLIGMNLSTVILTTLAIFIALFPHYVNATGGANGRNQAGESVYFTYLLTK